MVQAKLRDVYMPRTAISDLRPFSDLRDNRSQDIIQP